MQIKNELEEMTERMFNDDLLNKILETYKQEMKSETGNITEKEYVEGVRALASVLNDKQKNALSEMENLCANNVKYALKFGFTRGMFVGFQQFFVKNTTKRPFEKFVINEILEQPRMNRYEEYSNRRIEFNEICKMIEAQLDKEQGEHLISIYCGWEDRLYGVLRHAFYMGYRYALFIIEEVEPIGATFQIVEKTLMTEYEIGFTCTAEERERYQINMECTDVQRT